jgi:phenylpyruvate tautomerase PptA (4-oxalocrotonate tautomerase family)
MPYLQLDVNDRYSTDDKKRLAARLCDTYSRMMSVDIRRISIAIREVGEGGVWRMIDGEPVPVEKTKGRLAGLKDRPSDFGTPRGLLGRVLRSH